MELINYLENLDKEENTFIICENANCEAFEKAQEQPSPELIEELTLFRGYSNTTLNSKEAIKLLKGTEVLSSHIEHQNEEMLEKIILLIVNYGGNHFEAKEKLERLFWD